MIKRLAITCLVLLSACTEDSIPTDTSVISTSDNPSQTQPMSGGQQVASVADLLSGLEQRVIDDPHDVDSWVLLAHSYQYLGRSEDANRAFSKAVELGYQATESSQMATNPHAENEVVVESSLPNLLDQAIMQTLSGEQGGK